MENVQWSSPFALVRLHCRAAWIECKRRCDGLRNCVIETPAFERQRSLLSRRDNSISAV